MDIQNVGFDKYQKAAFTNRFEEGDRLWLPDDFEDDLPDYRIELTEEERHALRAGVIAHDDLNQDNPVGRGLGLLGLELIAGNRRTGGMSIRANEYIEYRLLEAGAWAARRAPEVVMTALLEQAATSPKSGTESVARFERAISVLSHMTTQLELAGIIPPEQPSSETD